MKGVFLNSGFFGEFVGPWYFVAILGFGVYVLDGIQP